MKMKCINNKEFEKQILVGKWYDVQICPNDDSLLILSNEHNTKSWYKKSRFQELPAAAPQPPEPQYIVTPDGPSYLTPAPQAAAVTSHENDAYQKIVKIEKYETTDGKSFLIQNEAMKHQLMLDVENDFVEPHDGEFAISLRDLLEWSKAEPESFDTLVRLVGEQR